ncbi:MAG: HupE/UreJ family protein [Pseudomonadota bacterium]
MARLTSLLLLILALGISPDANAHNKSVSYSDWSVTEDGSIIARVRVPARQTTLLLRDRPTADPYSATMAHIASHLKVLEDDLVCPLTGPPQRLFGAQETLVVELRYACQSMTGKSISIQSDAFFDYAAGHLHFVRSTNAIDEAVTETILTTGTRQTWLFSDGEDQHTSESDWALLGVGFHHILGGPDHLVFVLGIFLVTGLRFSLVPAVTGFTIGHSLSLAAAVTGLISSDSTSVEGLIALTIWLLGALALKVHFTAKNASILPSSAGLLICAFLISLFTGGVGDILFWVGLGLLTLAYLSLPARDHLSGGMVSVFLTACLGLAHGLGFAGGLQEAFQETDTLFIALIAFNVGVEAGQLAFLCLIIGMIIAIRSIPLIRDLEKPAQMAAAIGVTMAGAFWFAERIIFTSTQL